MLEQKYCIFLDILGFSNDILEAIKLNKSEEHLNKFKVVYKKAKQHLNGHYNIKTFSDNIYIDFFDGESNFGQLILDISNYQLEMVLNGFFVRGGWCFNESFIDDEFIYGKGLIVSHDLESKQAIYPLIKIDDELFKKIKTHINCYAWKSNPQLCPQFDNLLIYFDKNKNKHIFVNYLYPLVEFLEEDITSSINMFLIHKKHIEKNVNKFSKNPKVQEKYIWCAEYHNYFCDVYFPQVKDLKITTLTTEYNFLNLYSYLKTEEEI
ncbi:MAG: hypothetical protein MJH09_09885 [Cetobacterium sp.]|nr:hypothetical protein [Cetobacterium sp.]